MESSSATVFLCVKNTKYLGMKSYSSWDLLKNNLGGLVVKCINQTGPAIYCSLLKLADEWREFIKPFSLLLCMSEIFYNKKFFLRKFKLGEKKSHITSLLWSNHLREKIQFLTRPSITRNPTTDFSDPTLPMLTVL